MKKDEMSMPDPNCLRLPSDRRELDSCPRPSSTARIGRRMFQI